ncbi:hypothetical protein BDP27DRAFT_331687 [Rhodocollybia butyracea]|uniref:Mei2-like C-terminal RNA recognition motif domain-containing protein n=1 Tax=Rhodocollybia butyracea TaxID=206335 RepID=A0A9P5QAV9_9AGAR|nr:hypothetical protein BDP27DRAFT_331687 [Rhodocollybia butyracea]
MLRNIPFHLKMENIKALIWEACPERIDFIYLPLHNQHLGRNAGYAIVNFITTNDLAQFYAIKNGHAWSGTAVADKVVEIVYAHCQGKTGLVHKFFVNPKHSIRHLPEEYRPCIFHSEGPLAGKPETIDEAVLKIVPGPDRPVSK